MNAERVPQGERIQLVAVALLLTAAVSGGVQAAAQSVTLVPTAARYAGIGTNNRGYNSDFGPAGTVELATPTGLAFDFSGNLIVADRGNNCIRRIDTSSQHMITTIAGLAVSGSGDTCNTAANAFPTATLGLLNPAGVAIDQSNNIFIADTGHNCVRRLPAGFTGVASLVTVAGTCGATNLASTTPVPVSLTIDSVGNLFILTRDTTDSIYQVLRHDAGSADGSLCRIAGAASAAGVSQCADVAVAPTLRGASGLAVDSADALYIADTSNNCVRKEQGGTFSVAVGTCGSGTSVITGPTGLTFNLSGSMFISSADNNQVLRYNQNTGQSVVIAGNPNTTPGAYAATQDGIASTSVPLNQPSGLAEDANSNLYVADSSNSILRQFKSSNQFPQTSIGQTSSQQVLTYSINSNSTLTVTPGQDYSIVPGTDTCTGPQTAAAPGASPTFCKVGIVFSPTAPGNRYSPIRVTNTAAAPNSSVFSGLQGVGLGPLAQLFPGQANTQTSALGNVIDIAHDSSNNLYVLSKPTALTAIIQRYPAGGGAPTILVPIGAGLNAAQGLTLDAARNIYVTDNADGTIQRYGADGSISLNYITGLTSPHGIAVDGYGNLLMVDGAQVLRIYDGGERKVLAGAGAAAPAEGVAAATVQLTSPYGVTVAPNGTVYFTDAGALRVYSVDNAGLFHIVAGNGTTATSAGNTALGLGLINPVDVETDAAGDLFIADLGANKVYTVFASSDAANNLRRILGDSSGTAATTGDGGVSTSAATFHPAAASATSDGLLYVGQGDGVVRSITFPNSTLDFGTVAVDSVTTKAQSLWNNGNDLLLRTGDPAITNPQFVYNSGSTTCGSAVNAGLLCDLAITFEPTAPGPQSGTATIVDNGPSSPQGINLTGNVVPALLTGFNAAPETENYGGPYVGNVTITTNGGTIPNGTVTFTINGTVTCTVTGQVVGTVTCTLPGGTLLPARATPYPVVVTFTGNFPNQTSNTTLTVSPRPLTETVNSKSKIYLSPNPILDGTPNGLINGVGSDSFTVTYGFGATPITTTTVPGFYNGDIIATITPNGSTNPANYTITNTPGNFTVNKGALPGFSASPEVEAYGGVYTAIAGYTQPAGGTVPAGTVTFLNGTTPLCAAPVAPTVTCTAPAGSGLRVGTYPITVTYSGDSNYNGVTTNTTLTVTPVPLTVTVANQTKVFGAPVPNLNGSATVTGLVNGDTVGSTIILSYATTVTAATPIGTYPNSITVAVSGTSSSSYIVSNTPGSFTVTGTATTTTLTSSASAVAAGTAITFTARVASTGSTVPGGNVVFTSDGATIGTGTLDATGTVTFTTGALPSGTHTIVATYAGNANFAGSSATVTEVVAVPVGRFTMTVSPDTQLIRGPGNTTYTITVTSTGGFTGPVALACSGLPADATCALSQTQLTLTSGGTASATFTTTTTSADAVVADNIAPVRPDWPAALAISTAAAFPMQLSGLGLLMTGVGRRRQMGRTRMRILLLMLLAIGLIGLAGCGCPSTAFHTYPVTITASSVFGGPAPVSATTYLSVGLPQ